MAYLNLLPWREAQRKQQQARFVTMLSATGVVTFLVVFGISAIYGAKVEGQNSRNNYLQSEITILDQRIVEIRQLEEKKKNLQRRIELIAELQRSRNLGTQIMDEIAKVVPAGVYLSSLEKKGPSLLLVGKSESNNRLSNMLRSVENSELLTDPLLEFIEAGQDSSQLLSDFKMHVMVKGFESVQGTAKSATPVSPDTATNPAGGTK
jgi:type IV pilus assembly protein PilN